MKKALLFSALALAALAPARAAKVTLPTGKYPVPVERRVPWTIISGTDCSASDMEGANTGGIDKLIDRNPLTYWHSNYNACDANDPGHSHWFMIDRGIGADKVPFDMLSIQQRVTNQGWNGAVTEADIYVTDEFIGLLGGSDNKVADDATIAYFLLTHTDPTLTIEPETGIQEAQLYKFDTTQTGRFILFVVEHAENPDMNENQYPEDKYACLSEFNLFAPDTFVDAANFEGNYAIGENPENTAKASKRTVSLTFSDSFTNDVRFSPMLQSNEDPYIPDLNWLDWQGTYFDITPLMIISVADNHDIQINATGTGSGMYKALYVDYDNTGNFSDDDLVKATTEAGSIEGLFQANLDVTETDYSHTYRARYIVDSEQITSPTPREGIGAAGGIVVDFMITIEQAVNFNVVFTYNGSEVSRINNQNGYANEPFSLATPDFFDIDANFVAPDPDSEEYADKSQPYDVEVPLTRVVLPFAYTSLENSQSAADVWDNLQWQAINHHTLPGNGKIYVWTVDITGVDATKMMGTRPANYESQGFADEQLWAFVGDIANGFKIYNKAFDATKCVYVDGTSVKFGEPGDAESTWYPAKASEQNAKTHCAFKANGTQYINLNVGNDSYLAFWKDPDQGSTCWFTPAGKHVEDFAKKIMKVKEYGRAIGLAGTTSEKHEALCYAAVEILANPCALSSAEIIANCLSGSDVLTFEEDAWYRLANYQYANNFLHYRDDNIFYGNETNPKSNYNSVIKFIPIDGSDNYHIFCQGLHFGQCRDSQNVTLLDPSAENKGQYNLHQMETGIFAIKDETGANRAYLHQADSKNHRVVGWETSAGATRWYVVLAEDIEMSLPETKIPGLGNAGFGFFPFPVSSADEGTKLYTIEPTTNTESGAAVVTYKEVASVPAETAFIAANEELSTVTLQIGAASAPKQAPALYADAAAPAKFADGTFRAKDAEVGDYVLDNTGDVLSFKKTTAAANVAGNYVYLPAANVTAEADELPFNDPKETTTDIREINVEQSAAAVKAVYDLQGRRLAAPAKGINIINGKKVLVK